MGIWRTLQFEFVAMASPCAIWIDTKKEQLARKSADAAIAEVHRIEQKYSRYQEGSVLSRINREAANLAVAVDSETAELLNFAERLWHASGGCFDISTGVFRRIWDFRRGELPSQSQLDATLPCVGWPKVSWNGTHIHFACKGMEIDFGGIGKEYAADRVAQVLRDHGFEHALVNLGGDVHALGARARSNGSGQPWSIGIRHPRMQEQCLAQLPLHRGGLATSGDYERFFERDGRRYCHILNPLTGMPVTHWQSVSVLSANATSAGAMSSIAMLKEETAIAWLDAQSVSYLAVRSDGQVFTHRVAA